MKKLLLLSLVFTSVSSFALNGEPMEDRTWNILTLKSDGSLACFQDGSASEICEDSDNVSERGSNRVTLLEYQHMIEDVRDICGEFGNDDDGCKAAQNALRSVRVQN